MRVLSSFISVYLHLQSTRTARLGSTCGAEYYQWVPLVLLVQAAAFWAPSALWSLVCDRSAIPISSLLKTSHWAALGDDASREKNVAFGARLFFDGLLRARPRRALGCQAAGGAPMLKGRVSMFACLASGGFSLCAGNYLALAYLGLKLVWIAHAGAQLYFIQYFIGTNYTCVSLRMCSLVQRSVPNVQCTVHSYEYAGCTAWSSCATR